MQMIKAPPSPRRYWPEIPSFLERTLLGMLAKDPRRRPALSAVLDAIRDAQISGHGEQVIAEQMRTGELDHAETMADVLPGDRATSRWRPLRR